MTGLADTDCVFCKIVSEVLPCHRIYSDDHVFAFLDIGPVAPGHVLLTPRIHCQSIAELSPEISGALGSALPRLARAVFEVTGADGLNILQNNGACAGQVVNHVHIHLIPRKEDDGLGYRWRSGQYNAGEAEAMCELFDRALA